MLHYRRLWIAKIPHLWSAIHQYVFLVYEGLEKGVMLRVVQRDDVEVLGHCIAGRRRRSGAWLSCLQDR